MKYKGYAYLNCCCPVMFASVYQQDRESVFGSKSDLVTVSSNVSSMLPWHCSPLCKVFRSTRRELNSSSDVPYCPLVGCKKPPLEVWLNLVVILTEKRTK